MNTEQRLEYAMSALKAIANMRSENPEYAQNSEHLAHLAITVARITVKNIGTITDAWPAGREKEAAAYNRQYLPR